MKIHASAIAVSGIVRNKVIAYFVQSIPAIYATAAVGSIVEYLIIADKTRGIPYNKYSATQLGRIVGDDVMTDITTVSVRVYSATLIGRAVAGDDIIFNSAPGLGG